MEHLAYRAMYLAVASNQHLVKSVSFLSKITQIHYPASSGLNLEKSKKVKCCWICNKNYEHLLMLVMHLEIVHAGLVEKY